MWMLPRIPLLRQDLPEIDLRIQTSVRDLDLEEEAIPLGIRGGDPAEWLGYHATLLAPEVVNAVASPSYVESLPARPSLAEMTALRLIHLEEPVRQACDWREWFQSAGIAYARPYRPLVINDYVLVIQAVLAGEGIALGWTHLIDRQIRSGALVPVGDYVLETGNAFHVVWPRSRELSLPARKVRDWLVAQGAASASGSQ
jgi:DNA-binding transcriptional LysR family regulator